MKTTPSSLKQLPEERVRLANDVLPTGQLADALTQRHLVLKEQWAVRVRDEHGVDVGGRAASARHGRRLPAQRETAIDEHARERAAAWAARLDPRGMAVAVAGEAAEAQQRATSGR